MSRYEGNNKAHLRPKDYDKYGDVVSDSEDKAVRLIDANALKERIMQVIDSGQFSDTFVHGLQKAIYLIDNAPTVSIDNYSMGYQEGFRNGYAQCFTDKEERKENSRLFRNCGAENAKKWGI